jgi:hypothetical protein
MLRTTATSNGPACRVKIAMRGSANRVMSDPKTDTVAADQTRTKAWLAHSGDEKGLRTTAEHTSHGRRRAGGRASATRGAPMRMTIVSGAPESTLRYTPPALVRQNPRTTRPVVALARSIGRSTTRRES